MKKETILNWWKNINIADKHFYIKEYFPSKSLSDITYAHVKMIYNYQNTKQLIID